MQNLPSLVLSRALKEPQRTIMRRKRFGVWRPTTGAELTKTVADLAAALTSLGLQPGQNAGILAAPSPDWLIADLAIQCAGGVSVGFHGDSAPGELVGLVRRCAPRVLFVDSVTALDAALDLRDACPSIHAIVCSDAAAAEELGDETVLSFDSLVARGAAVAGRNEAPWRDLAAGSQAAIIPTSGASAPSRGARLSHAALCAAVEASLAMVELRDGDERLSMMPASHVFERVFGLYASIAAGVVVNFPESAETVSENLRELQPQVVTGSPALWRKIESRLALASSEATSLQRSMFESAMHGGMLAGLVLGKVRRDLGLSRARIALSAGGPLARNVQQRLNALGVPLADVYALAEAGPLAIASGAPRDFVVAKGAAIEIDPQGKLQVRTAAAFSGYVGEEDRAGEWLASGDVGQARSGGFTLAGAQDSIAVDASSVWPVEEALATSPYVSAAIVTGAARENLSALVFIDYDTVVRYAQSKSTPFTHFKSLSQAGDVRALLDAEIARINTTIAPARVTGFTVADRAVEPGHPELGPAMTLRRRIALQSFSTPAH